MLKLIEGGFFAGGYELIRSRIAELCRLGKKSILIVPEQETVSAEGEMANLLPPSAPLYFEVTNFTRFTDTVFRSLGGLAGESADSAKRALIMWKTLSELAPALDSFKAYREIGAGSVTKMLSVMKEMQSHSITPMALADAADGISAAEGSGYDGRLVPKLRDLSMIMTLYKKILKEHFSDSDDSLLIAEEKLSTSGGDFLSDTEIFIDGFTSFTEPQYKMIGALMNRCNVTVGLTLPKASPEAFEFSEIRASHKRLVNIAGTLSVDVKLEKIDGRGETAPLISEIASLLWKSSGKVDTDALRDTESFRIFEAETPYDECDFVAQDIRRRVMAGEKYSDFGIIARDIESFNGILDLAFEKAKVPLFMSKRTDITSYEAVKLIFAALTVISGGFSRRDVISYAKCSFSGTDRNQADELEIYAEKWQINGKRFTDGITWNMNPYGYSERRPKDSEERLLSIDAARRAVILPLLTLDENMREAKTVRDFAGALVDFLLSLDVPDKLLVTSKEAKLSGDGKAQDIERLWSVICDTLDSLCDILGEKETTLDTFINLLKISFSGADIGRIPSFKEEVTAGSADTARMRGKKHIYIIGANAGAFPLTVDDDSYFTSGDKRALSEIGLEVATDEGFKSARELYYFSRAISYARVGVSILYAVKDTAFKAAAPSEAIGRIRELTCGVISPLKISDIPLIDRVYSAEYALEQLSENKSGALETALLGTEYGRLTKVSSLPIKNASLTLSRESLSALYGTRIPLTQSKLELYAKCPMSYFCTYNLGLKPEERAEFDSRNIGNFLHSVLENFFSELKQRGKSIADISENEKTSLVTKVAKDYTGRCFEGIPETSARLKDTVNKLSRAAKPIIDGLCDEFAGCKYEPVFFELEINKNKDGSPSPIIFDTDSGKEVYITGKIDRVDSFKKDDDVYIRVIDYKSGRKIFSPKDLKEGTNLQMFLYLKSIVETKDKKFLSRVGVGENGRMIPAGVIYVKTAIDDVKISKNSAAEAKAALSANQERLGMLLNDDESLSAMNKNYIPIKFKNDGTPDSRSESKLYTESGWDRINDVIEKAVTDISDKMISGDISANPKKKSNGKSDACAYCEFKAICRNAN